MAWPKTLKAAGIIETLKRKISSVQQKWRSTRRENERLRREIGQLRHEQEELYEERQRLQQEPERLRRENECRCQRRVQGRDRRQTSDALSCRGATGSGGTGVGGQDEQGIGDAAWVMWQRC